MNNTPATPEYVRASFARMRKILGQSEKTDNESCSTISLEGRVERIERTLRDMEKVFRKHWGYRE